MCLERTLRSKSLKPINKLILPALALVVSVAAWATVPDGQSITLKPNMEQRFASNLATKFLTNWHYKDTRLDNELSSSICRSISRWMRPTSMTAPKATTPPARPNWMISGANA
jgi:hypothetical protein